MALIYEWGFFVEPGKEDEFRRWLADHEDDLARAAPPNYEYLGTYTPVWAPGGRGGDFHQIWRYGHPLSFNFRDAATSTGGSSPNWRGSTFPLWMNPARPRRRSGCIAR